ncbi:hypothetical protein D9615_006508 [Tricholomella constricta]|uniref:Uncharacterized protein n=1 Tax=Tricholomella constricta TaxID=117010 RepID=A0A8H5HAA6_9AGAR|nr:hypothetical protein D9615_006508 [Tricholomella constricta]
MPKRSRADPDISSLFERLFDIANTSKLTDDVNLNFLKNLKHQALSAAAAEEASERRAAKDFPLDETVKVFGLSYKAGLRQSAKHRWEIEASPDLTTFTPSPCIVTLMENYTDIYDRSSQAACRIGVDLVLCECLAVMASWLDLLLAILLKRKTSREAIRQPSQRMADVHRHLGIPSKSTAKFHSPTWKAPNRLFHSLILCVEAKFHGSIFHAFTQLVVYLACLRQSRSNRGRSDTSVYGVATDGLSYIFVTITHEGVVKLSKVFDVLQGELPLVLGCLRYILEKAMSMIPNSTPEKGRSESDESEVDADPLIDVDDHPNLPSDYDFEE